MALIDTNTTTELTTEQKQAQTRQGLVNLVNRAFALMRQTYADGSALLDANPFGLTRDEVLAGLGDDAAELLRLAGLLRDAVNGAVPNTIPDPEPVVQ